MENVKNLADNQLYKLCRAYGHRSLQWRYKFIGLLPEVYRRKLYEKKGFSSIFVFSFQLAGLTEQQVRRTLNLDKKFEERGLFQLREALVSGEVSVNKLAQVASIATPENEGEVLQKSKILPKSVLETMVRDFNHGNGLFKIKNDPKSVPGNNLNELNLSPEIKQKLLELQTKGIDLNKLMGEFLDQRDRRIEEEKQKIVKEDELAANGGRTNEEWDEIDREMGVITLYFPPSRYIRARTKNVLKEEFGKKCAIPHCPKHSKPLHHTDRFSLSGENNPYYLAPLCKDHHALAHSVDQKVQQKREGARSTG